MGQRGSWCILHTAVLNTDPDSCPLKVKPHKYHDYKISTYQAPVILVEVDKDNFQLQVLIMNVIVPYLLLEQIFEYLKQ